MNFNDSQKGVSLLITFFVMGISLAMVLGMSIILLGEIKTIRGMGYSVVAFYAADSGIEKTLYYDRKQIPLGGNRGICNICELDVCSDCDCDCDNDGYDDISGGDCGLTTCTDCTICYTINFGDKSFRIKATISPGPEPEGLDIFESFGSYKTVKRAIQLVLIPPYQPPTFEPTITNAKVEPRSVPEGIELLISADIYDADGIDDSTVRAYIQSPDEEIFPDGILPLGRGVGSPNYYSATWTGPKGVYWVDIFACDDPPLDPITGEKTRDPECNEAENI